MRQHGVWLVVFLLGRAAQAAVSPCEVNDSACLAAQSLFDDWMSIPKADLGRADLPPGGARLVVDCRGKHLQVRGDLAPAAEKALLKRVYRNLVQLASDRDAYDLLRGQGIYPTGVAKSYQVAIGGARAPTFAELKRNFSMFSAQSSFSDMPKSFISAACFVGAEHAAGRPSAKVEGASAASAETCKACEEQRQRQAQPLSARRLEEFNKMKTRIMKTEGELREFREAIDARLKGDPADGEATHLIRVAQDRKCEETKDVLNTAGPDIAIGSAKGMSGLKPGCGEPPQPTGIYLKVAQMNATNPELQAIQAKYEAAFARAPDAPATKALGAEMAMLQTQLHCQTVSTLSDEQIREYDAEEKTLNDAMGAWSGKCFGLSP